MKKIYYFIGSFLYLGIMGSCSNKDNIYVPEGVNGSFIFTETANLGKNTEENIAFIFTPKNSNIKIKLEAFVENNILHSILSYKENSSWNVLSKFENNDIKSSNFKENMYAVVKNKANYLKKDFSYEKLRDIDNVLDVIPEKLFEKLSREKYYQESTLSFFYHLSTVKSAKRSLETKTDNCDCNFYANSLDEKTPFFCEEDKPINAISALHFIKDLLENKSFAGKVFIAEKTLNYLEENRGKYLSASKVDRLIKDEFNYFLNNKLTHKEAQSILPKTKLNTLKLQSFNINANSESDGAYDPSCLIYGARSGRDCGCCSNYSGPCYWCALGCYLHDQACENCDWYCGWKCVPEPCNN